MTDQFIPPVAGDKKYYTAPAEMHDLVCGDVVYLGEKLCPHSKKMKTYVQLRWFTEDRDPEGNQYLIAEKFNFIFGMKPGKTSKLYDRWVDCFGPIASREEAEKCSIAQFLGFQAKANIINNTDSQGRVWANIKSLMPNPSGNVQIPETYVRVQDREDDQGQGGANTAPASAFGGGSENVDDDDIPF